VIKLLDISITIHNCYYILKIHSKIATQSITEFQENVEAKNLTAHCPTDHNFKRWPQMKVAQNRLKRKKSGKSNMRD
jgi:hypothetical protein